MIRAIALDPERCPGLVVNAAFHALGKVFAHGGVLPWLVDVSPGRPGLPTRRRWSTTSMMFSAGRWRRPSGCTPRTSRTRCSASAPRTPVRPGCPARPDTSRPAIFTADLRELDHHRFRHELLPQIVGHTASRNGCIRYSPRSRLRRDYIGVDVGRQTGLGNGGLLRTDLGWMAVVPGEGARLIEASPMFVELVHEAEDVNPASDGLRELLARHLRSLGSASAPRSPSDGRMSAPPSIPTTSPCSSASSPGSRSRVAACSSPTSTTR